MNPKRPMHWILALAIGVLLIPGCMRVVILETPYYAKGPQQIEPPDGYLKPGTKVFVFGEKDGYARMFTLDGISGHVWSDSLGAKSDAPDESDDRK